MHTTNPTPSRRRTGALPAAALALALSVSLTLAACGDDDDGGVAAGDSIPDVTDPGDGDTTTSTGGADGAPIPRPTGGDEVVVQVVVGGGFVPVEQSLVTIPVATLLGDGTLVTPGPITLMYPGPAIAPLQATTLDAATVDALLERADELGLLDGPLDFGLGNVADAPTTTVTFVVDGRTVTHDAYALGMEEMEVGAAQQANREVLQQFLDAIVSAGVGDRPYEPQAIAVTTLPMPVDAGDGLAQAPVAWPLATVPGAPLEGDEGVGSWPCLLVEGADAATLTTALASANAATPWTVGDVELGLVFRPVLPGQPGCPA
jgi:hypothetical protein